jgi:Raf kinase inhibitor-like YbhB/YbcL family protein
MKLISSSFEDGGRIPVEFAFCAPDPANHVTLSHNRNPHLAWTDVPARAKSFVLICHDPDVPSRGDDVNKEGRSVPATLPRIDFFHWVLIDIPPTLSAISGGEFASSVTARGKPGPMVPVHVDAGMRQGLNDYTGWFAGDKDMGGNYFGYDGPCPPWNDTILHHYVFTLYALDVARCPVEGNFTGTDVRKAIEGHVLGKASITGVYALNPALKH